MTSRFILCGLLLVCVGVRTEAAEKKEVFLREIEWMADTKTERTYSVRWENLPERKLGGDPIDIPSQQATNLHSIMLAISRAEGLKHSAMGQSAFPSKGGFTVFTIYLMDDIPAGNKLLTLHCEDRNDDAVSFKLTFRDPVSMFQVQEYKTPLMQYSRFVHKALHASPETPIVEGKTARFSYTLKGKKDWYKD